jgi:sulfite exporter TauE/SafE/copper chaperone CopZ
MHCKSCEILIGEKLLEIKNITRAKLSFKNKSAEIYSKSPLDLALVSAAVSEAGYEVGTDRPRTWFSHNLQDYTDLGMAFLLLTVLFFLSSGLGLFNISVGNGSPSSLMVVLLIGLTAGISTCMALIGGLVLGVSARHNEKHPESTPLQKFRPHLFFNLGRVISFFILGGLIGMIGQMFQLSSPMLGFLTIIVGLVMLMLGLKLTEISPRLSNLSLTLPSGISKFLGLKKHNEKEYSHLNSMILGGLTFFLPCGFTQAMQLYAMSTGNFLSGALIMAVFAIGTAPGLLSIGGLTSVIKGGFAKFFFKFAGLVVIFLALFNISNGFNLTGFALDLGGFPASNGTNNQPTNVTMENGVQIVRMTQSFSGYSPNKFVVQKGLPVKWIINATALNACSSGITIPRLGLTRNLVAGENTIEFTPAETGTLKFTCTMGMYPGEFTVVDKPAVS